MKYHGERSDSPSMRNSIMQKADEDRALFEALWAYINPTQDKHVEKATTFDFLLLLIFNVSRLSESEMCKILAKHLHEFYGQN